MKNTNFLPPIRPHNKLSCIVVGKNFQFFFPKRPTHLATWQPTRHQVVFPKRPAPPASPVIISTYHASYRVVKVFNPLSKRKRDTQTNGSNRVE